MANQILTRQEITWESLEILENELNVLPNFYRDLAKFIETESRQCAVFQNMGKDVLKICA